MAAVTSRLLIISLAVSSRGDILGNDDRSTCLGNNGMKECRTESDLNSTISSNSSNSSNRSSNFTDSDKKMTNINKEINQDFQCGIYLATSSIPNSGFGIYTTRSIKRNDFVQPYSEAPSIAVTDFYATHGNTEEDWGHSQYYWDASGRAAYEGDEVSESVMTFGSLCNYHPVRFDQRINISIDECMNQSILFALTSQTSFVFVLNLERS